VSALDPRTEARELALQFLYQAESERLLHFSESHFQSFVKHQDVKSQVVTTLRDIARGTLDSLDEVDARITAISANWKLSRMGSIDRNVLRLAAFELLKADTPPKVVLNEAIELAKKYGSAESGAFVNGLLDKLARELRTR